jgi:hypothetical protein
MGLLLICPHCRAKTALSSRSCPACGADLRNLPLAARCYFFGSAEEEEVVTTPLIPAGLPPAPTTGITEDMGDFEEPQLAGSGWAEDQDVSLCEALDRILNKGAVLYGEVTISVADIDLIYLGLQVILASMETARGFKPLLVEGELAPNLFEPRVS